MTRRGMRALGAAALLALSATLSAADRKLAAAQKICPVTSAPLDSMGGPVRIEVAGRVVFLCCEGCEDEIRKDPKKYFAKLPQGSGE